MSIQSSKSNKVSKKGAAKLPKEHHDAARQRRNRAARKLHQILNTDGKRGLSKHQANFLGLFFSKTVNSKRKRYLHNRIREDPVATEILIELMKEEEEAWQPVMKRVKEERERAKKEKEKKDAKA